VLTPIREDLAMGEKLPTAGSYEPPRIERVLTPEELAREIQYAGATDVLSTDEFT
jgi:hypothetical protein